MQDKSTRNISSEAAEEDNGARIDLWLSQRFTYHSRKQWQDAIRKGQITINDKLCRASAKLKTGDKVSFLPETAEPEIDKNFEIIFEDEYLLAVNKSGSLPCHPAGPYFQNTLWYLLKQKYEKIHFINRIDRETSGIVLIAKDAETASLCNAKIILKRYIAVVEGKFPQTMLAEGYLYENREISRDDPRKVRKKRYFCREKPDSGSETAKTLFKLLSFHNGLSVVEADLFTGRLHQIRATLCSLGYPIVGDKIYGRDESIFIRFVNGKMTEADKKTLRLPRQALHSSQIIIEHPVTAEEIEISAPLPNELIFDKKII